MERYIPGTLLRFKNAQSVSIASYFGCRSLCNDTGLKIQSGFKEDTISISGLMAVPTVSTSLYLSGIVDTVLLQTPTRSSSSLSQISAVAGEVAMILGLSFIACTFFFAASTAAFSSGSSIFKRDSASSSEESFFADLLSEDLASSVLLLEDLLSDAESLLVGLSVLLSVFALESLLFFP